MPLSSVIRDAAANLYGTTLYGGAAGVGVVYKLTPNPNGTYTESAIHQFTGGEGGGLPYGSLIFDPEGNIYGATSVGGNPLNANAAFGTVFELAPHQ